MIDSRGFRQGVGIILVNAKQQVFLAKRIGQEAWQFPQGGVQEGETPAQTVLRELYEETGLRETDVTIITETRRWLYYRLPRRLVRQHSQPLCIGQKQKWFLLRFIGDEKNIRFDAGEKAEFDDWRWVDYWQPLDVVIHFKYKIYRLALKEFSSRVLCDKPSC